MTHVILTSNLRLFNELKKCGVPQDVFFIPIELKGTKYHYRFVLRPGEYDVDDFIQKMSETYFTLGHDGERIPMDSSRYWDEIANGDVAGTLMYTINPD